MYLPKFNYFFSFIARVLLISSFFFYLYSRIRLQPSYQGTGGISIQRNSRTASSGGKTRGAWVLQTTLPIPPAPSSCPQTSFGAFSIGFVFHLLGESSNKLKTQERKFSKSQHDKLTVKTILTVDSVQKNDIMTRFVRVYIFSIV